MRDTIKTIAIVTTAVVVILTSFFGLYKWADYQSKKDMESVNSFINDCHLRGGIVTPSSGLFSTSYVCNPK